MTAQTLISVGELAKKFKIDGATVTSNLAKAKVEHSAEFPYGRGVAKLYEINAASRVLTAHAALMQARADAAAAKKARKLKPATPAPSAEPATALAPTPHEPPKYLEEVLTHLEILNEQVSKLTEQNVVMFKMLQETHDAAKQQRTEITQPVFLESSASVQLPQPTQKARLPKVWVVGLHDNKMQHIRREFASRLDLTLVNADDAKTTSKRPSTEVEAVILFADFINHGAIEKFKATNANCIEVSGGLTSLRSALTSFTTSPLMQPA